MIFFKKFIDSYHKKESPTSAFSRFFVDAKSGKRKKVFTQVVNEANTEQKRIVEKHKGPFHPYTQS